jgi:RNA polymerase sigma-70 factor (ECF subfamily)
MPESLRVVFVLKEVEGYDHAEIADLLSISPGAARVRLHRAWRLLRSRLEGRS